MRIADSDHEEAAGDLLAAALDYAAAGLPVLPLDGKVPRNRGGLTNASTDVVVVAEWWRRWPDANVGVRTGRESGIVVLDIDTPKGGARSLKELESKHGKLPVTARVLTGSGGQHVWFRHPGAEVRNSAGTLGPALDVRGDGGYVVVPPSLHESGRPYKWLKSPTDTPLADPPAWLLEDAGKRRNGSAQKIEEVIPAGRRNAELASLAGTLRRRGLGEVEILITLRSVNEQRCHPPLDEDELEAIAASIARYAPETGLGVTPYTGPSSELDEVVEVFRRYLHLPDPTPLYVVLATVIANRMAEGDPVWVVLVAGSSRGKTEFLLCLDGLEAVRIVGKLTVAALLSGTAKRERAKGSTGGVLREIGSEGVIVIKDLGVLLAMQRDTRAEVLQMLRDVYDGRVTRDVGVEGGVKLEWTGNVGLVGAATSALDRAHAVLSALGERWLTLRLPEGGEDEMTRRALETTNTAEMRAELRQVVRAFLETRGEVSMRRLKDDEKELVVALTSLVCLARSPVERDPHTREIVLVHDSEGPARIARQLHKLLVALEACGLVPATVRRTIVRVGLDSVPSPRREALHLLCDEGERSTSQVARALDLPTRTTERALEELTAHGLLVRRKSGDADNSVNLWTPTTSTLTRWQAIRPTALNPCSHAESSSPEMSGVPVLSPASSSPEMSGVPISSSLNTPYDDKTGELCKEGGRRHSTVSETFASESGAPRGSRST